MCGIATPENVVQLHDPLRFAYFYVLWYNKSMSDKKCTVCKEVKPLDEFNRKSAAKDGLQSACRECSHARFKAYYDKDREAHRKAVKERNKKVTTTNRQKLYEYLSEHPCLDCGEDRPIVLEFDHLRDKRMGVARMVADSYSWKEILLEIDKCEVVCRNCHHIRTMERSGSWHASVA